MPTLSGAVARPDRAGTGILQCFMVVVDSLCRQFLHNKLPTKSHVVADVAEHVSMYDIRSTRDSKRQDSKYAYIVCTNMLVQL